MAHSPRPSVHSSSRPFFGMSALLLGFLPAAAFADQAGGAKIDSGDTAWMLMSTALVLLMTPGLAFFYGGMVRTKNVVSTLFQNFFSIAVIGLIWAVCGYSLVFSHESNGVVGTTAFLFLRGVGQEPNADFAPTIPHLLFMLYQCMFAVITPALITGAIAERIRFKTWLVFMAVWSLVVYVPVAHWVWGAAGWIHRMGGLDFAGGMVVHMTAGYSALVVALMLSKRRDFTSAEVKPHDAGMILLGTALLWFGWFGFNAGSALGANGVAVQAFATTFFASAASMLSWTMVDWSLKGKPSAIGAGIGAVAGLATITPAAGYVSVGSAIVIGILAGVVCNASVMFLKNKCKIDDTLDVFGCHGIGGTLGIVLTGVFATRSVNPAGADGLLQGNLSFFGIQCLSAGVVAAFSLAATFVIVKAMSLVTEFCVDAQEEISGLDLSQHSECISSLI